MLPRFDPVLCQRQPLVRAIEQEAAWMQACASDARPRACLWQAPPGWVVPRRYTQLPGWGQAAIAGELQVRASGGGLVPQGPGLWNLSLVWVDAADAVARSTAVYQALCARLAAALAQVGVQAEPGAVPGSFCDGRYNLAVAGRKLVGTAQAWRRLAGRTVGLAHAVIVVDADPQALAQRANAVEVALGHAMRYDADSMTSVRREAPEADEIEERLLQAIVACLNMDEESHHGLA